MDAVPADKVLLSREEERENDEARSRNGVIARSVSLFLASTSTAVAADLLAAIFLSFTLPGFQAVARGRKGLDLFPHGGVLQRG